jgi:endoglucanase Acf2
MPNGVFAAILESLTPTVAGQMRELYDKYKVKKISDKDMIWIFIAISAEQNAKNGMILTEMSRGMSEMSTSVNKLVGCMEKVNEGVNTLLTRTDPRNKG